MSDEQLIKAPCPFPSCGARPDENWTFLGFSQDDQGVPFVYCSACGATGPLAVETRTWAEAAEKWNEWVGLLERVRDAIRRADGMACEGWEDMMLPLLAEIEAVVGRPEGGE